MFRVNEGHEQLLTIAFLLTLSDVSRERFKNSYRHTKGQILTIVLLKKKNNLHWARHGVHTFKPCTQDAEAGASL